MAIHLQRLLPYLSQAGLTTQMYSVGRCTPEHPGVRQVAHRRVCWFFGLVFTRCEPVHYIFSDNTYARFAASLLSLLRRAKVVLRIGGESLTAAAASPNPLIRFMTSFAVRHVDVIVGVNEDICRLARRLGGKKVIHIPGFIPVSNHLSPVPAEVESFLNVRKGTILLASGEVGDSSEDDLYGAYLLLNMLERMPAVNIIFYAYTITRPRCNQDTLHKEILRRNLNKRYLLYKSEADLLPAMRRCTLFIRPTRSDGDSNSIREALHLGLPVVASDCVVRPEGVVTFKSGNVTALQTAVADVLNDVDRVKRKASASPKTSAAESTVALFKELLNCKGAAQASGNHMQYER